VDLYDVTVGRDRLEPLMAIDFSDKKPEEREYWQNLAAVRQLYGRLNTAKAEIAHDKLTKTPSPAGLHHRRDVYQKALDEFIRTFNAQAEALGRDRIERLENQNSGSHGCAVMLFGVFFAFIIGANGGWGYGLLTLIAAFTLGGMINSIGKKSSLTTSDQLKKNWAEVKKRIELANDEVAVHRPGADENGSSASTSASAKNTSGGPTPGPQADAKPQSSTAQTPAASTRHSVPKRSATERIRAGQQEYERLVGVIGSYETDFDKAVTAPGFNDVANAYVSDMIAAMRRCRTALKGVSPESAEAQLADMDEAVAAFRQAVHHAEDCATAEGLDVMGAEERRLVEQIRDLLDQIRGAGWSAAERRVRTHRLHVLTERLRLIHTDRRIPDEALDNLDEKITAALHASGQRDELME